MDIQIIPLKKTYLPQVFELIDITVRQTFIDNDVVDKNTEEELVGEIERIILKIQSILSNNNKDNVFVAIDQKDSAVGIVAMLQTENSQKDILKKAGIMNWEEIVEISMCYVHPKFQKKGIGKRLFRECVKNIQQSSYTKFFLYSGYPASITVWKKLIGKEYTVLTKYFPDKQDCYVWYGNIKELK